MSIRRFDSVRLSQAVLLVGGKGTRLKSVIRDRPKPMAEVAGRPFLERLILSLRERGIRHVVLCISHMGERVREHFGDGSNLGINIVYSEDPGLLGTGGALRKAFPLIDSDPALVLNGDSYCEVNLAAYLAWHQSWNAQGSLVLVRHHDASRYGQVQINEEGLIMSFKEKGVSTDSFWINAGVYLLSHRLIDSIPTNRSVSIERDVFPRWVSHGLYGFPVSGRFIDIGTPESYAVTADFFVKNTNA